MRQQIMKWQSQLNLCSKFQEKIKNNTHTNINSWYQQFESIELLKFPRMIQDRLWVEWLWSGWARIYMMKGFSSCLTVAVEPLFKFEQPHVMSQIVHFASLWMYDIMNPKSFFSWYHKLVGLPIYDIINLVPPMYTFYNVLCLFYDVYRLSLS